MNGIVEIINTLSPVNYEKLHTAYHIQDPSRHAFSGIDEDMFFCDTAQGVLISLIETYVQTIQLDAISFKDDAGNVDDDTLVKDCSVLLDIIHRTLSPGQTAISNSNAVMGSYRLTLLCCRHIARHIDDPLAAMDQVSSIFQSAISFRPTGGKEDAYSLPPHFRSWAKDVFTGFSNALVHFFQEISYRNNDLTRFDALFTHVSTQFLSSLRDLSFIMLEHSPVIICYARLDDNHIKHRMRDIRNSVVTPHLKSLITPNDHQDGGMLIAGFLKGWCAAVGVDGSLSEDLLISDILNYMIPKETDVDLYSQAELAVYRFNRESILLRETMKQKSVGAENSVSQFSI